MKIYTTVFLLFFFFLTTAAQEKVNIPEGPGRNTGAPYYVELPDSLPRLQDMIIYLDSDFEKAKWVLDTYLEMDPKVRRKLYADAQLRQSHADYLFTTGRYRESIEVSKDVITDPFTYEVDTAYMFVLDQMMESSRMINDFDGTMKYALMMLDVAKRVNNLSQIGRAYLFMGKTQYRTGDRSQGLRYFTMAEENFRAGNDLHWLSYFYLTLANIYMEYSDYGEAYRYAILYENSLNDLELLYEHQNEIFIEIYRGRAYVILSEILFKLDRKKEASDYYDKFLRTWNASDAREGVFIVPYLLSAGRYAEAEKYVVRNEEYIRNTGDTINDNMLFAKEYLQRIYEKRGETGKSLQYSKQSKAITDSLRHREHISSAIEMATIYETAEKEATIASQKEKLRLRGIYTGVALLIVAIMAAVLILIAYYNRLLNRKNRVLVEQISREHSARLRPTVPSNPEQGRRKKQGKNLFEELEALMQTEKLYLDNSVQRDEIVYRLGTNKNYLLDSIKSATGMNFTDYVNSLRLETSLDLLRDEDEIISSVAEKCGFKSPSHYHRLFTEKYGVSPNTYRKLSRTKSD